MLILAYFFVIMKHHTVSILNVLICTKNKYNIVYALIDQLFYSIGKLGAEFAVAVKRAVVCGVNKQSWGRSCCNVAAAGVMLIGACYCCYARPASGAALFWGVLMQLKHSGGTGWK